MQVSATAPASSALERIVAVAVRLRDDEARLRRRSADPEAYEAIFRRAAESVGETQKRLARERKHGEAQWSVLELHPQSRRLVMIRNDRRLHTWGLYDVLVERSCDAAARDARTALQMAELALAVARVLDPEEHGTERIADFQAGALAAVAEARHRLSDRGGAWQAFEAAREQLEQGSGDPLERAEMELLRARLLRDFGTEVDIERSLRRAGKLLRSIGDKRPERDLLDDTHGALHRQATR